MMYLNITESKNNVMGQIFLDKETIFSFLYDDCKISKEAVEKFVSDNLWDNSLTFKQNADNCRELEREMNKI